MQVIQDAGSKRRMGRGFAAEEFRDKVLKKTFQLSPREKMITSCCETQRRSRARVCFAKNKESLSRVAPTILGTPDAL